MARVVASALRKLPRLALPALRAEATGPTEHESELTETARKSVGRSLGTVLPAKSVSADCFTYSEFCAVSII